MRSRVSAVLLLLVGSASAQFESGASAHHVHVRVAFSNGVCDLSTRVLLIGVSAWSQQATPNDQCEVDFRNVPDGTYHLRVSGNNFADTDNIITANSFSSDVEVNVRRADDPVKSGVPASPSVSATDLAIPKQAQKEFVKANDLISHQDFAKAIEHLNRAIAIYPSFADAYNNLGVIYGRTGDRVREREELEKAVRINDHFAPAYVNLARMSIADKDFPAAEAALEQATSKDPTDAMTLLLLSYAQFMNRHFDQAIASCHRAHGLPGPHAFAHQVAARAYEQKHDSADAIAELNLFLKEEPTGERAENARKELVGLQTPAQAASIVH